jgi:glycosyltransferase involved in cell wall biosynthesis
MNIVIVNDVEIASQGAQLAKALNRYTNNHARCITVVDNYLHHKMDLWLGWMGDKRGMATQALPSPEIIRRKKEAALILNTADFFIFRRENIFLHKGMKELHDVLPPITPYNCVVTIHGSEARLQPMMYHRSIEDDFLTVVSVSPDYSMMYRVGFTVTHIQNIIDMSIIPKKVDHEGFKLVCAPTNKKIKQTDLIQRVCKENSIDLITIENTPWEQSLRIKAECDVNFDQICTGCFGYSSVESMAMGQVSMAYVDHWIRSQFLDIPIVQVTEESLAKVIIELKNDPERVIEIGKQGVEFVKKYHDPQKIAQQWDHLIKFVSEEKINHEYKE